MSTFAFGTQRVSDENLLHIEALKEAIEEGVRVIETATNYTDGGAQKAIAKVMALFEDDIRDEIKIINSSLYMQNDTQGIADHIEEEIKKSLKNLQLNSIETFLIECEDKFISDAFTALEKEIQKHNIKSYGICNKQFSDIEKDIEAAQKAAMKIGNEKHSFTTLQLSINLLEKESLQYATLAKKRGFQVLACRPLDAQKDGLMYRLAEYEEPKDYYHTLNELLEICENDQLQALYNLIEQMDMNKHKFGFIGEYDSFLVTQILPHIKKTVEKISPEVLDTLLEYIDRFLREYRDMVAYESSKMTKTALKEYFKDCNAKMQECALRFLLELDDIDFIIVGMRKPSYVQEIMALKS